ncbi:MAG: Hint domain-containing protein [bacterium]
MQHNAEQKKTLGERFHTAHHFVILGLFIIAIILGQSVFAVGVQTPPTSPATPATFLNISTTNQAKTGWLGLGMLTPAAMPTAVVDVKGTFISDVLGVLGLTSIAEKMKIGITAPTFGATDPTLAIEGSRIRSTILSGIGERSICADANGRLVLCGLPPTPTSTDATCGNAASYSSGGQGNTTVNNFDFSLVANPYLCKSGTPVLPVAHGGGTNNGTGGTTAEFYWWTCQGVNGGLDETCYTEGLCPGGTGCFLADTTVTLADGSKKPIQDIVANDKVRTLDSQVNNVNEAISHRYVGWVYGINGSKPFVTANHPMMTPEGWKSFDAELTARTEPEIKIVGNLVIGDTLIKEDGSKEVIKSYTREWMDTTVYNLSVSGNHVYYADDYAVHNAQGSTNGCTPPNNQPPNPTPTPDPGPLCGGVWNAGTGSYGGSCNVQSGMLSAQLYNYTRFDEADCGTPIFHGYGCNIVWNYTNSLGNHVVDQINCTDTCRY